MIQFKSGDIFAVNAEAIVNPVNCVGVMGGGLALQFKTRYPENLRAYAEACQADEVQPGRMFVFETNISVNPRYIVNFPTKRHWQDDSRIDDIEDGLSDLARIIRDLDIRSIAVPALGCGLGGLPWNAVRNQIEGALGDFNDVEITVFEPGEAP